MKTLLFALLISAQAFAGEVVVMDIAAVDLRGADRVDTRFNVNEAAGTVSADMTATRQIVQCMGGGYYGGGYYGGGYGPFGGPYYHRNCTAFDQVVLTQSEEIPGMTVADKIVSIDGINCGKMGLSRILKVPTFFMSGNCKLVEKMVRVNGERRLQVKLITK
jgi:hypothetical protein